MNKKAFTLLEMLIVLTVVSILIPTVFSIVFVIVRQQVRIYRVTETRRQGDAILTFIKDRIVRSKQITHYQSTPPTYTPQCITNSSSFTSNAGATNVAFLSTDNTTRYRFYSDTNGNLLYASQATAVATPLNNTNVTISDFVISCNRSATAGAPLISISYIVTFKDNTPTAQEGTVSLPYQTKIKLRE